MEISTKTLSETNPNLSMPVFKWGARKHLRFMKPDFLDDPLSFLHKISITDRTFACTRDFISGGDTRHQPCSSSSPHEKEILPGIPSKRKKPENENQEEEQQKQEEGEVAENAIGKIAEPESPKLWNQRTRSATCRVAAKAIEEQQQKWRDDSPPGLQRSPQRMIGDSGEKKTVKFSISLSRKEIEEDFIALTGSKPSLRPKKRRPKKTQGKLDTIFPGQWLASITPNSYEVADNLESRKK